LLGADQRSWSLAPDDDATMSPEAITATFAPLPQTLERPAQFTVELRGRGVRAPLAAESRVVRWIVIDGGVRAAVVRSRARLVVADAGVEGSVHWVHEQIVLEDGLSLGWRLDQAWSLRVPELDGVASGTSRAAMRYVGGCSTAGLEAAAAPRLDARVVRARSLLSFVVRAVFLDQRDVGLSFFDASIVQRHGPQVVWAALRRAIHGFFPTGFVVSREGDSDAPMRFSATLTAAPTDLNEPARARVRVEVTQRDAPVITAFDANGLHVDADTLTTPRPDERSPVLGRATGVGR
jgi:hypothetical protein